MTGNAIIIPKPRAGRPVWLQVGTLFDGARVVRDAHVVYDAEKIQFVGGGGRTPPAERVREGQTAPDWSDAQATLLPGLVEAHAHLFLEGGELDLEKRAAYLKQGPTRLLEAARGRMAKLARLGIAGIRDAGDKDGVGLALSAERKRYFRDRASNTGEDQTELVPPGKRPSRPYIDSPGAAINHRGRYGSFMGGALEDYGGPAECVAARVAAGADRIKLIPTGIINFKAGAVTTEPQMTVEELRALVAAAKAAGKQTFAHASGADGIERVVEAGVDSVEHGFFIRDDQLARMRDRDIAWVPTFAPVQLQVDEAKRYGWDDLVVGNLRRILDAHAASLVKARAMGVRIIAGSDAGSCGVPHGLGLWRELELMEAAGLSAEDVLRNATGASVERLGFAEDFGRIVEGARSRFIVTRHSPLERVANLRAEKRVVFDGEVFGPGTAPATEGL